MKSLNICKLISNAAQDIADNIGGIEKADSYEKVTHIASMGQGYIECMAMVVDTMICKEDNDFTAEMDEVIDGWMADIFQTVAKKAIELGEPADVVQKALTLRDKYRAS